MIRIKIMNAMGATAAAALMLLPACGGKTEQKADTVAAQTETTDTAAQAASTPDEVLIEFAKAAGAEKDSVITTASGLKYSVVKEGTGASPSATDEVTVYYTGMLTDGTVFDSTSAHGDQPISFPLNRVIKGWTEGLQLMKEGGKYVFYIPSEMAYGSQGQPGVIPPDAPLVFEVELVKVGK